MENLLQPTLLLKPFAQNGDKNDIPLVNNMITNPQLADLTHGFPEITSLRPAQGGLPPERKDFNALGYLTTSYDYFYQAGGVFTFNQTISDAIGGYPLNARLWYMDANGISMIVRSTIANNTNNFLTDSSCIGIAGSNKPWVVESFRGIQLNENYVTNCITEIPQDVKITLNNGVITVKAGSKIYIPDGFEEDGITKKFDVVVLENDISTENTSGYAGDLLLYYQHNHGEGLASFGHPVNTGTDVIWSSAGQQYYACYNVTENLIKWTSDSGTTWDSYNWSIPIALLNKPTVSGGIETIKKVFNGFCYHGSSIFILPKVKMVFPNGINPDGTTSNISYETDRVGVWNCDWSPNRCPLFFDSYSGSKFCYPCSEYWVENYSSRQPTAGRWYSFYSPAQNKIFFSDNGGAWTQRVGCIVGIVSANSNYKITDFEIKTVYRSADVNEVVLKEKIQYVSTLPASPEGDVLYLIPQ